MRAHTRTASQVGAGLAALLLMLSTSACSGGSSPSAATSPGARTSGGSGSPSSPLVTTDPVTAAAGWLATQFVDKSHLPAPDGDHFDQKYGSSYYPDYGANADAIFGLAAAGVGASKIATALGYLRGTAAAYTGFGDPHGPYDGSIAKLALAVIVAGGDPRHFAGHDLIAQLGKDECSSGSCTAGAAAGIFSSISESFVMLAEARAHAGPSPQARRYFLSLQCRNGGFTAGVKACTGTKADIDATSYAIMALEALGGPRDALTHAVHWLVAQRAAHGYWVTQHEPNVDSTGLAAAALAAAGVDVSESRTWLLHQQVPAGAPGAGAMRYAGKFQPTTASATSPSVLATAQAINGLAEHGSLATVSAAGAEKDAPVFAPAISVGSGPVHAGAARQVSGVGFAAGEQVTLRMTPRAGTAPTGRADAFGSVHVRVQVPASTSAGPYTVVLTGTSSHLNAQHRLAVTG